MSDVSKPPFFSVIIPAYNRADLLKIAIDSVLQQTYRDFEVIIVDDDSKDDNVRGVCQDVAAKDERIRFFAHEYNRGVSAARNTALAEARGQYVSFLDSDDVYLPWTLQTLRTVAVEQGYPSFIAGRATPLAPDDVTAKTKFEEVRCRQYSTYFAYRRSVNGPNWWFQPSGVAIRADALRMVAGFWSNRANCEDIDLWQRLGNTFSFVRLSAPATFGYRIHSNGLTANFPAIQSGMCRIIDNEKAGLYPGGAVERPTRVRIVASQARHAAREMVEKGHLALGFKLYLKTFLWNVQLGRWIFIFGLPSMILASLFRRSEVRLRAKLWIT